MTTAIEAGADKAPLEDLMVAMDVVDTVRHRDLIVDRELDASGRRQRLMARLREIYSAQGIEVSDGALAAGVEALEEDRFSYTPTPNSFSAKLARFYVRRNRWGKPVTGILLFGLLIWLAYFIMVVQPEARLHDGLPAKIEAVHAEISAISASTRANEQATRQFGEATRALDGEDYERAEDLLEELRELLRDLKTSYDIRIVSRPNELSGVWRIPDVNPDARNYYLIVEAVTAAGTVMSVPVRNEEDGLTRLQSKWGVRVSEEAFEAVAADKRDDGIVQSDIVGAKSAGQLDPEYRIPTSGAAITEW